VALRARTEVLSVGHRADGVVPRTSAGEISARAVVIAAGPWSERLLAGAVARAPRLTATLQQVRYFRPREPGTDGWPTSLEWPRTGLSWYVVPMAGGAPGVKVAAHVPGRAVDPRAGPFGEIDPVLEDEAARYVRTRLPGLDPAGLAPETCLYTMTADEDFGLDREGPVIVGGGCSGHAFKFAPLLGEMLADLALGAETRIPRERFSLSRPTLATAP
jgi:sarcosine oxidase